ncbi:MAG: efflux transporter outer membrane subunit [Pseudomonadota bacterium]|nr:efflux transporter outer membrane subunit [Pseudomonadota bacterium]
MTSPSTVLPVTLPTFPTRRSPCRPSRALRRIGAAAACAVSGLGFVGCASTALPYGAPALPVAAHYAEDGPATGDNAAAVGWRDYFVEPRLQALVAQALAHNRDLRVALLRVQEARAAYGIQGADRWPTLNAQAGESRSRTPADLNLTGRPLIGSEYQVALGVASWEIDFWGRVRSLQDAALETYLATDEARRAATIALIAQVVNSDLQSRETDERLVLARQTIASRRESLRIFTRRVEVGSTSRLALTQVQTLLSQAEALGTQLEQARAAQRQALTLLVGAPLVETAAAPLLDERHLMAELRPGLPSELLTQRPDVVAAEHRLKATHASIAAARAAFFPRVALTGSLGTASAELDGLFASGSQSWSFMPSISLPLFDGGRLRNNLSLAETRRELAVANYEQTVQGAFRDVNDALSARRWLDEQLTTARAALFTQAERARLSQLRYDQGAAAFLDVLDAQRDLLVAEQALVQTRRALLASRVALYAALGGGSMALAPVPDASAAAAQPESTLTPNPPAGPLTR